MVMASVVLVTSVFVVAGTLYFFQRRRKRDRDPGVLIDSSEGSFYPEIEKCHEINARSLTCSCQDFREGREQFRHDDPRRLCKHLVRSFVDAGFLPADLQLFKEGVERSALEHEGFPADRKRFDTLLRGKAFTVMIPGDIAVEGSLIDVYCEAKCYRYSPSLEKWAEEAIPPYEGEMIRFLYEKIGKPVPEARLKTRSSSVPAKAEKGGEGPGTAEKEAERLCALASVLRTLLPPDGDLALKETRNYIALTFNGSRRWICRLHLNSRREKYMEFPDGKRHSLNSMEDIVRYKAQLLSAYGEKSPRKGKSRTLFPANETMPSPYRPASAGQREDVSSFSRN